ncbi:Mss4-like protein [Geopyxis carbonaria]|nr:Mss4-like protein [Geopyxis carbonaria]
MASATTSTYHGNCHCGAFKYTLTLPAPITSAMHCACSICVRHGFVWTYLTDPAAAPLAVTKGSIEDTLACYAWGTKASKFHFCATCGSAVVATRGPIMALNIRTLQDLPIDSLELAYVDGASIGEPWKPYPAVATPEGWLQAGRPKTYTGSCHCGAVRIAAALGEIEGVEVRSCNCSLCNRRGELWVYPKSEDVVVREETEGALRSYRFGKGVGEHRFCGVCGVSVVNPVAVEGAPLPVNARCLEGVDVKALAERAVKVDGAKVEPLYVVPE